MAGIFDKVATRLAASADGQIDKWADKGVEALSTRIAPTLPPEAAGVANAVAGVLSSDPDTLHQVSHAGFTALTSALAVGAEDEAYLIFLRETATDDQRQDALLGAMRNSLDAKAERDANWAKTKKLALDVLAAAGKAAIPLLLAMV